MKSRMQQYISILLLFSLILTGCSGKSGGASKADHSGDPRDNTPKVLVPSADGTDTHKNEYATLDVSNSSLGYLMVKFSSKGALQVTGPSGTKYNGPLTGSSDYEVFPFSDGDGKYEIKVLESVEGDSYVVDMTQNVDVKLEDEFLPFLYPNQYVNFTKDSQVVKKGAELAEKTWNDLEVVENVYNYVTENITYDTQKAESVTYGYVPDCDKTLKEGTGICFDYASVMTAMLRSQGIPTKLEVGYSGEALHSWISTYIKDVGWVDNIIEFDGKSWKLMDPTLASNNDNESVNEYIGDGSNYTLKYTY